MEILFAQFPFSGLWNGAPGPRGPPPPVPGACGAQSPRPAWGFGALGVGWARSRSTWESPDCGQVSRDGDAGLANGGQAEPLPPTRSAPRPRSRPGSHGRGGVGGRALPGGLGFPASKGRGAESKCLRRAALPRLLPMAPASSCPAPTGSGLSSSSLPDLTEAVRPGQLRGAALGEGRASACGGGVRSRSPGLLDRSLPVALDPALRSQGSLLGGAVSPKGQEPDPAQFLHL